MKKDKSDRLNKELYATTAFFNNKKKEDYEAFHQKFYAEREKKKGIVKKETPVVREREDKKIKTKMLQKKFIWWLHNFII